MNLGMLEGSASGIEADGITMDEPTAGLSASMQGARISHVSSG
jgi:hypothetical protein